MRSGSWDGAVTTDNVRVTVAGTVRPVKSVRIQSGMRDGHPRSDASSWCVESTIEWADPNLVTSTSPHPFGGAPTSHHARGRTEWLPEAGDEVVIETGDGELGQWWVQHRGVIDDTTGSIADGTARSTTVDMIEELDVLTSFPALLAIMPPSSSSGGAYRWCGLQSTYLIDRMFRLGGWHATPPASWDAIAASHGMGSLWPQVGTLTKAHRLGDEASGLIWGRSAYGVYPHDYESRVLTTGPSARPVVTISALSTASGSAGHVDAVDLLGRGFRLGYDSAADTVRVGVLGSSSNTRSFARGGAERAAIYCRIVNTTTQEAILRLDNGTEHVIEWANSVGGIPAGWTCTEVRAQNVRWWTVENNPSAAARWNTLNHATNARIRITSGEWPWWRASRDIEIENAAEWLQDQVDAEAATMWLDEDGTMQWASRGVLEAQSPARTITSVRDVDDIQWESRRRRLARSVEVAYDTPAISMAYQGRYARDFWVSGDTDLGPGEVDEITVTPDANLDWIGPDLNPHHVSQYNQAHTYYVEGSIFGGTQYNRTNTSGGAWAQFLNCTMEQLSLREFLVTFSPWSTIGANQRVKTTFPLSPTQMLGQNRGLLALRGQAIVTWARRSRTSSTSGGVGKAVHNVDVGWRVQHGEQITELVNYLRAAVTDTRPYVTGLTINHDPRLQVGDKIRVQDVAVTGIDFDLIIQERDIDTEAMTETISGRVTTIRTEWRHGPSSTDESRLEPAGPTPITPSADWAREEAV